ncbi:MAG: glycosyltransferase [Kiritimatiellia bacterium]
MKIRLFTDLRFVTSATPTGVGKHIFHMARGLADSPCCQVSLLAASDQIANPGVLSFLPAVRLPLPWKVSSALWTATSRPYADRWCGDADWVYCPKNDWISLRTKRLAVTIHGAHELDPAMPRSACPMQWLYRLRNRVQYRKMCCRANVIFTVSEFLKRQVCDWFSADPDKVVVIGNGVDPVYFAAGAAQAPGGTGSVASAVNGSEYAPSTVHRPPSTVHRPPSTVSAPCPLPLPPSAFSLQPSAFPYLLAVGGLNFLDGGDRVIALGQVMKANGCGMRIKVAGCQHEPGWTQQAAETGVIDLLGYVPAEQLALLMRDALALYYPTRYETFGMAAAEAMAAGTPVITCHSTAVPEIVGDAGIYVDPDDAGQAMEAILAIQANSALRLTHVTRGRQRAAAHTWEACVERLVHALELRM